MEDIIFGQFALPVILTVILGVVFKMIGTHVGDRFKPLIAIGCGIALGCLAVAYRGLPWNLVTIVDHVTYGFMVGASAVGLYELQRTVTKPRQ